MTQLYDRVVDAIRAFIDKGGDADTIILPFRDLCDLRRDAPTQYWTQVQRRGEFFAGVRIMEGQPFDHGFVEGHEGDGRLCKIQL